MKSSSTAPRHAEDANNRNEQQCQSSLPRVSSSWRRFHGLCVRIGKTTKLVGLEATVHSLIKGRVQHGQDSFSRLPKHSTPTRPDCSVNGVQPSVTMETEMSSDDRIERHSSPNEVDETCASEQTHLPVHWISKANAIGNSRLNRNRESACRFPSGIHRLTCAPKTNRRSVRCEDHGGRDRFRKGAEVVCRIPWSVSRLHPSGQFVHRWTYRGVGPPETREHLKVALSLRRHETDWIASIPESLVYQLGNNHGALKGSDGGNG